jgi:hypothetical protein
MRLTSREQEFSLDRGCEAGQVIFHDVVMGAGFPFYGIDEYGPVGIGRAVDFSK